MSFILPSLSFTQQHVALCLNAKPILPIMINIYTTVSKCRDTGLFFLPSFTSVYPGNIGQMLLTNRSQTNQRVQEIHHNINTGVLRDVSIDIRLHEENINSHQAEDCSG